MFTSDPLITFSFDGDYVRRLTEGDPSVEEHFTAYFGEILSLKLRRRVQSVALLEDIKQETFLRVLRHLRRHNGIEQPERLGGFVNSVCNNVLLELFRSERRHPQFLETVPDPVDVTVDLENTLVTEERKRLVRSLLEELPDKDRTILRMVFLEEREKDEVCAAMHVDRDYLRVLLFRARERFKKIMRKQDSVKKSRAGM
jgi:RNA polymerase sigma-70 factor, ECF subfamily